MEGSSTRRFFTRTDIEDAAKTDTSVTLTARDIITDEAAQRAGELGVEIVRECNSNSDSSESYLRGDQELRPLVKAAVIHELGYVPEGLETALDRVFRFNKA